MTSLSILALTALSGAAMAQHQGESPQSFLRLAERVTETQTSLTEAISLAEEHTEGVAIGARLTSNRNTFLMVANGAHEYGDGSWSQTTPADVRDKSATSKRTDNSKRTNTPSAREASRSRDSATPMFAIVTCVIDRARVRDVVIDMSDGTVLGMQSVNAAGQSAWEDTSRDMSADQSRFALVRATDLMNATARNGENERVGDIDELVLNPEGTRIVYGVLRRGGFLGFNESRYAIPTGELSVPRDGRVLMNLSNSDFDGHSGFDENKWPTKADPQWSTSWSPDAEKAPHATRILKATELIGSSVQCSDGRKVGEISDLIVEPRSGQVVYAIVECDHGRIVAPMSVLGLQPMGEARVMKMTHAEVMALPTLSPDTEPDWNDARWNRSIHDNYKAKMDLTAAMTNSSRP